MRKGTAKSYRVKIRGLSNEQVAHLWAHQAQAEAHGSNMYFIGRVIYSGSHFPIARIVDAKGGRRVVLFTTRDYSMSTQRHKSYTRSACFHMERFDVADVLARPGKAALDYFRKQLATQAEAVRRKRSSVAWSMERVAKLSDTANAFAHRFGFKTRFTLPAWWKAFRAEAAERDRVAAVGLAAWLAAPSGGPHAYLRLVYTGETPSGVQTSMGAVVPVEDVTRALPLALAYLRDGRTYKANGHTIHLGPYTLDRIDERGDVFAGCHHFQRAEVLRFAEVISPGSAAGISTLEELAAVIDSAMRRE